MDRKWEFWNPPDATHELPITAFKLPGQYWKTHIEEDERIIYFRSFGTYDKGSGIESTGQILKYNDRIRLITLISRNDVELEIKGSKGYVWEDLWLTDPAWLEELVEELKEIQDDEFFYRLWTDGQRVAIVRQSLDEPETADKPGVIVPQKLLAICFDGKSHDLLPAIFTLTPVGFRAPVYFQLCDKCRQLVAVANVKLLRRKR